DISRPSVRGAEFAYPGDDDALESALIPQVEDLAMAETTGGVGPRARMGSDVHQEQDGMADRARRAGEEARDKARGAMREKAGEWKEEASDRADRWTRSLGGQVESVARALTAAAESLGEDDQMRFSDWSRSAAQEVERLAGYLREEDP